MSVLFISPGYPAEMPFFVRGLARSGARVIGLGDQHSSQLPAMAREHLADHWQVGSLSDVGAITEAVRAGARHAGITRIESLWEPTMLLAAHLRETLGIPGMGVEQTMLFRDKERMKQALDAAGVRTPRHVEATTADQVREAAGRIGYPLIVKPIAGAGSADTHRVDSPRELESVLRRLLHVPSVSVEEFIDGDELTHDTICARGRILVENVCWYRPRPLVARQLEWISPQTVAVRALDVPFLDAGRALGRAVLDALEFRDGFTHMEWYRTAAGEAVFGEIGARPPGARTVDVMNYCTDSDLFERWAEAVLHGELRVPVERRYNAVSVFKRAQGQGRIQRIEGLGHLMAEYGEWVVALELLPVGAHRRDWLQTLTSDGMVIARHPELHTMLEIADRFGSELQLYAG